ncbi:hypothetical protein Taro_011495 [Colocasia esculenta]|uniref:Uncharacterized protein n=1 Tax=Colocasia esculenta TaxID=4460 RepID=A0A843UCR9_COLES|nr:hypothetical protein [Colocasia esculenta]
MDLSRVMDGRSGGGDDYLVAGGTTAAEKDELGYTTGDALMHPTPQSNQARNVDMQMLAQGSSVQNLQMPQGSKQMKTFRSASAPPSPVRESPSFNAAQGGSFSENNLQIPQIGANEMPAGNCLPQAFAQLGHLTQEEDLSDSLDSEMDMNMDEHP